MSVLPFGEYRPDVSDYLASTSQNVLNVVPRADGYGPFPSLAALSAALGANCRGAIASYKTDGSLVLFAATATDIFKMNNTTLAFSNVSKAGGPYAALSSGDLWQFRQFNNLVIAVQGNVVPQVFDISGAGPFADLAGNPPQARYIDVVGKFVVLTGMPSNPNRAKWSGLNDVNGPNSWTAGINSSDEQDFADGGYCRGVAGGENGIIFQDTIIRRMTYLPGDPRVFQIEKISEGLGVYGPYSIVRRGSTVFFYSLQGFHKIDPGSVPVPIGRERVDRTFFKDWDNSNPQLFAGCADPRSTRILWPYKSVNGQANQFDKVMLYDTVLDRFTPLAFSGEYLFSLAQPGVTLEQLDTLYPGGLDSIPVSLDSFPTVNIPELAAFDVNHKAAFFRGASLEATLETAEQGTTTGQRIKIKKGVRPVTDAPAVFVSTSKRETLQQSPAVGGESGLNAITGICNMLLDTRFARLIARIPAGAVWSYINGLEADPKVGGKR
jgi:hypothetical protein